MISHDYIPKITKFQSDVVLKLDLGAALETVKMLHILGKPT